MSQMEKKMKLGEFDELRVKNEAIAFLSKSIAVLSGILGIDASTFDSNMENPHKQDSPFYASYNVLQQEVIALQKLMGKADE